MSASRWGGAQPPQTATPDPHPRPPPQTPTPDPHPRPPPQTPTPDPHSRPPPQTPTPDSLQKRSHRIKISNRRATQLCNVSAFFLCKNMQFTGQKAEQPASTACLLARKCHRMARKMAANMRNATCARTETSKLPTLVALLFGSLFYDGAKRKSWRKTCKSS